MALTDDAHNIIRQHFIDTDKKIAVDATCGNGNDTLFLASLGFKHVIGFDIQQAAIDSSRDLVDANNYKNVSLILASHALLAEHIKSNIDCVMFNFGYLPTGEKSITTECQNSLIAIKAACEKLNKGGLISLMCYPGHPSGRLETESIKAFLKSLDKQWKVNTHLAVSPKPTAPILFTLEKI